MRDKRWICTAELVFVRQRPGSAKGVMFMTIEDETGVANILMWQKIFEKYRRTVLGSGMIGIKGKVQKEGEVVIAYRLYLEPRMRGAGLAVQIDPNTDNGFHPAFDIRYVQQ